MDSLKPHQWTKENAVHLLERACWVATPAGIEEALDIGLPALLRQWMEAGPQDVARAWPEKFDEPAPIPFFERRGKEMDPGELFQARQEARRAEQELISEMRTWWLGEMSTGRHPLREQMTLFWHGHFVSSMVKVRNARWMWQQNQIFRREAFGSLPVLAKAIVRDPAMMRYLDLAHNRSTAPNENFAREFFELFLLGEGNYTEEDIKEAARAFTGYGIDPHTGTAVFLPRLHDDGRKRIFGKTGNFRAEDVVDLTLAQPPCADFIAGKIWAYFSGGEADRSWKRSLGNELRNQEFHIGGFLQKMLAAPRFYDGSIKRKMIKSPVHWMMGASRSMGRPLIGRREEQVALNHLGQNLFQPPNVRGWEGGATWINTTTLPARNEWVVRLFLRDLDAPSSAESLFSKEERSNRKTLFTAAVERIYPGGLSAPAEAQLRESWLASSDAGMDAGPVPVRATIELLELLFTCPDYQLG